MVRAKLRGDDDFTTAFTHIDAQPWEIVVVRYDASPAELHKKRDSTQDIQQWTHEFQHPEPMLHMNQEACNPVKLVEALTGDCPIILHNTPLTLAIVNAALAKDGMALSSDVWRRVIDTKLMGAVALQTGRLSVGKIAQKLHISDPTTIQADEEGKYKQRLKAADIAMIWTVLAQYPSHYANMPFFMELLPALLTLHPSIEKAAVNPEEHTLSLTLATDKKLQREIKPLLEDWVVQQRWPAANKKDVTHMTINGKETLKKMPDEICRGVTLSLEPLIYYLRSTATEIRQQLEMEDIGNALIEKSMARQH